MGDTFTYNADGDYPYVCYALSYYGTFGYQRVGVDDSMVIVNTALFDRNRVICFEGSGPVIFQNASMVVYRVYHSKIDLSEMKYVDDI